MPKLHSFSNMLQTACDLLLDALRLGRGILQPRAALAAENLFLRKQLALYLERQVKPQRARKATRLALVLLSRLFPWRPALTIVSPWRAEVAQVVVKRLRGAIADNPT